MEYLSRSVVFAAVLAATAVVVMGIFEPSQLHRQCDVAYWIQPGEVSGVMIMPPNVPMATPPLHAQICYHEWIRKRTQTRGNCDDAQ